MTDINTLNEQAMQIILHAGNAKLLIEEAFASLKARDKAAFDEKIAKASDEVIEAHKIQTRCIQGQMENEENVYCILLSHAQDTIMTVKSELDTTKKIAALILE